MWSLQAATVQFLKMLLVAFKVKGKVSFVIPKPKSFVAIFPSSWPENVSTVYFPRSSQGWRKIQTYNLCFSLRDWCKLGRNVSPFISLTRLKPFSINTSGYFIKSNKGMHSKARQQEHIKCTPSANVTESFSSLGWNYDGKSSMKGGNTQSMELFTFSWNVH